MDISIWSITKDTETINMAKGERDRIFNDAEIKASNIEKCPESNATNAGELNETAHQ